MDGEGCLLATVYACIVLSALAGFKSLTMTRKISLPANQYFNIDFKVICRFKGRRSRNMCWSLSYIQIKCKCIY